MYAKSKIRRVVSMSLVAAALTAGGILAAAPAHAETLCNVNQNTWVRSYPGLGQPALYTIPAGGGFRVTGPLDYNPGDGSWWALGHGNGQADGWIPNDGRLYNCH